jgi:hypothetical protein
MKGTLHKTEQGWVVRYLQTESKYIGERQSLQGVFIHPDYVALCSYSFYEGKEIEFEILQEGNGFLYAHLFKNPKEQQDGYDTISELDKLAEKTFKGDDATTFVQREIWKDGYRKAKETLYTEEQVREAIRMAWEADSIDGTVDLNIVLHYGDNNDLRTKWSEEEIIQSLKQPKKD